MKRVYDIWKHTKGLPPYVDICLADEEDCWTFEDVNDAIICCNCMSEHNTDAIYYWLSRWESDNYICN